MKDSLIFSFNHNSIVFDPETQTQTPLIFLKVAQSQKVFHFGSNLPPKMCYITIFTAVYIKNYQDSNFAYFLGDLNQSEKPYEIYPPLAPAGSNY